MITLLTLLALASGTSVAVGDTPPAAATVPSLDARSARAVEAFKQVCLANAASLAAARQAATSAPWAFARKGDLPSYGRGPAMETYASGDVELLLRQSKKGFGCLIVYELAEAGTTTEALTGAISGLSGLVLKGSGKAKTRVTWTVGQPAGSEVQLTVYPNMTPRAPILALESKGSSN